MPDTEVKKAVSRHAPTNELIEKLREVLREVATELKSLGDQYIDGDERAEGLLQEASTLNEAAEEGMARVFEFREFVLDCERGIRGWDELAVAVREGLV